jgi:hypothetical protein
VFKDLSAKTSKLFAILVLFFSVAYFGLVPSVFAFGFNITSENFLARLYQIAFGIGIGSGVILVGVGGISIATAAGDPEKIKEGREQVTSALIGIAVVILSVVILNILGVQILGLSPRFWDVSF